ncbi:hypothetical protein CP533_3801 [Ophiocordyceps camponoti-saundersi (nom. inval.)]|nr:hypothetical protein CP533_3801 [Ophiocordyceps camponoti-saundersi (nom. inval.)]
MILVSFLLSLAVSSAFAFDIDESRDYDFTKLLRHHKDVQNSLRIFDNERLKSQTPFATARLDLVDEAIVRKVPVQARQCLHLRYMVLSQDWRSRVDIGHAHIDKSFVGLQATVTESTAFTNSTLVGWTTSTSDEVGASASFGLPEIFGVAPSVTVQGKHSWSSSNKEDMSKSLSKTRTVSVQGKCDEGQHCFIATWTYVRTISGRCGAVPVVDVDCLGRQRWINPVPWPKTSLLAFEALPASHKPAFRWMSPIAQKYWEAPQLSPPTHLVEMDDLAWHQSSPDLKNRFDRPCSFSYPVTQGGELFATQGLIRTELQAGPSPVDDSRPVKAPLLYSGSEPAVYKLEILSGHPREYRPDRED